MAPVPRLVLTGSESTGKTTLAAGLAVHYRTSWVPEFARAYAESRGGVLTAADVEPIAAGQRAAEDAAAGDAGLVVLDTNLLSTAVYARHYYGLTVDWLEAALAPPPPAFYLLCDIDLPWSADGIRDRGDDRQAMQGRFEDALEQRGLPFALIRGTGPDRLARAIAAADRWLAGLEPGFRIR